MFLIFLPDFSSLVLFVSTLNLYTYIYIYNRNSSFFSYLFTKTFKNNLFSSVNSTLIYFFYVGFLRTTNQTKYQSKTKQLDKNATTDLIKENFNLSVEQTSFLKKYITLLSFGSHRFWFFHHHHHYPLTTKNYFSYPILFEISQNLFPLDIL